VDFVEVYNLAAINVVITTTNVIRVVELAILPAKWRLDQYFTASTNISKVMH